MQATLPAKLSLARPAKPFSQTVSGKIVFTVAASLVVAACSHVSLPLPFTPVPLTLGNFAVIVVGMLLGPVAGFSALSLYLAEGAMGLPVFNPGPGGIIQLMGATGGYLWAYPLAAAVAGFAGRLAGRRVTPFAAAIATGAVGTAVVLTVGAIWLGQLMHLGAGMTWHAAVEPFLFGEGAKIVAAAAIFSGTRRWVRS